MNSLYDFIVKPIGERYANKTKVGNKTLILNTKIESFKYVNKVAEVIETPRNHFTPIKKGDLVMIHHNVFRRYYDIKGKEKNSRSFFKDNRYLVSPDQIYLYTQKDINYSFLDRCFVKPLASDKLGQKRPGTQGQCFCSQFQACSIIVSRLSYLGFQFNSCFASVESATRIAGSPSLGAALITVIFL